MIMAGTDLMPRVLARSATAASFMPKTLTSQESHFRRLTIFTVSLHIGHPALNTSILRFMSLCLGCTWVSLRVLCSVSLGDRVAEKPWSLVSSLTVKLPAKRFGPYLREARPMPRTGVR